MRVRKVDSLFVTRPEVVAYLRLLVRLSHVLMAIVPGYFLLLFELPEGTVGHSLLPQTMLFTAALTTMVLQAFGVYGRSSMFTRTMRVRPLLVGWSVTFGLLLLLCSQLPSLAVQPDGVLALWFVVSLLLLLLLRILAHAWGMRLVRNGVGLQQTVILGCTSSGSLLAKFLHGNADIRDSLIGFVDDRSGRLDHDMDGLAYLGTTQRLQRMVRGGRVQQVLVALPWSAVERMGSLVHTLRQLPVTVLLAPDMTGLFHAHHRMTSVAGLPMFNISELPLKGWSPVLKRAEDVVLSSIALVLAAPVMLAVALWIKLDSPGPVLFRQKRYGYNNRLIGVYKFRSMYAHQADANAAQQTTRGDPRVTRVGRFIRKTSLDELPQLLNVLGGTMSMVGPRPHATATKAAGVLFEEAVEHYASRHRVKPGITGWAQVNGYRGETDTIDKIQKRVEYDLEYIEEWSLWFDLYILARTLPAVLFTKAAY